MGASPLHIHTSPKLQLGAAPWRPEQQLVRINTGLVKAGKTARYCARMPVWAPRSTALSGSRGPSLGSSKAEAAGTGGPGCRVSPQLVPAAPALDVIERPSPAAATSQRTGPGSGGDSRHPGKATHLGGMYSGRTLLGSETCSSRWEVFPHFRRLSSEEDQNKHLKMLRKLLEKWHRWIDKCSRWGIVWVWCSWLYIWLWIKKWQVFLRQLSF